MCVTQKPEQRIAAESCSEKNTASCQGNCDKQQMHVEQTVMVMLNPVSKEKQLKDKQA